MSITGQDLFNLLPGYYRVKDTQLAKARNLLNVTETARVKTLQSMPAPLPTGLQAELDGLLAKASMGPLQSLMMLIAEQVGAVEEDLNQLYDDAFIETCAPWVIPYIGDLIGYQAVNGVATAVSSPRAEVAHTISFRRRKGTVLVMEQLAHDVTGWGAHAVEFFKLLADTQYMNHVRPGNFYAPDLRKWKPLAYIDGGFDKTTHKVDVRRIAVERGKYNIKNIGIFLWSLTGYGLIKATASSAPSVPAAGGNASLCFRMSPLGRDTPLFNKLIPQGSDITAPAKPRNVADVLKRQVLCKDIQGGAGAVYYGEEKSLALYLGGMLVSPYQIRVCDLSGPDGSWVNTLAAGSPYAAAVDPASGRISLPAAAPGGTAPDVQATFFYGFNGDIGGGDYSREGGFEVPVEAGPSYFPFSQASTGTLLDALNAALTSIAAGGEAVVEITDNGIYTLDPASAGGALPLALPPGATLEFRSADGCRPTVLLGGEIQVTGGLDSALYLNGLVLAYVQPAVGVTLPTSLVHVTGATTNQLTTLNIANCTLVPGLALYWDGTPQQAYAGIPALIADLAGLALDVQNSILGGIWVNGFATATISDSIIDATDPTGVAYMAPPASGGPSPLPGGSLALDGCTVIGKVYSSLLSLVSNSVFWAALAATDVPGGPGAWTAALWATRKQEGCVRFSYVPVAAILPRNFECVLEGPGVPQPAFVSLRYGDPGYCKLSWCTDDSIRRGADDGGEMGAFHYLLGPLRETDLSIRMQEYLPVGMEFGIYYEN